MLRWFLPYLFLPFRSIHLHFFPKTSPEFWSVIRKCLCEVFLKNCLKFYVERFTICLMITPQWGAADAEIKVPSGENTELKCFPFKAWSRSVYSHTCYAYCQGFLPYLFLPIRSIHLHFFKKLSRFFPVLAVANTGSCVSLQNKIGHPAGCRFPCWVPVEYKRLKKRKKRRLVVWWLVKWIILR